ncbi:hypothetical protein BGX30_010938 [Mortierella sp. GBA39]|nr:hypothetical protein BGX30_010938 [Mortierella sp. GBA39]
MNHETKEVILKVTDVVKTVVHFGFIPFVIYLGFTRTTHNDWNDPCHSHHTNSRRRRYGGQEALTQTVATVLMEQTCNKWNTLSTPF